MLTLMRVIPLKFAVMSSLHYDPLVLSGILMMKVCGERDIEGFLDTGVVGEIGTDDTYYLWTHKRFDIGYNGNRIVDVNLTSENKVSSPEFVFLLVF